MTKKELIQKINFIAPETEEMRNKIVCAMIGHSRIQSLCFGYYSCGRCGEQVGDSLASIYPMAEQVVIINHNCETCRENYKNLTWKDKIFVQYPFAEE